MLGSIVAKYIEKNIDRVCEIFLESVYDEEEEKYSDVYNYEINEYLSCIEREVNTYFEINKEITHKDIKTILIKENSFFTGLDSVDMNELDAFIKELLEICLKEYYSKINPSNKSLKHNLTEEDIELIKNSVNSKYNQTYDFLINLYLEKNEMYKELKKVDDYESFLESIKEDFIMYSNLQYKLCGEAPERNSIFESICTTLKIKRNDFIF